MAEIKVKFDLSFSKRFVSAATAAAMMLCAVPELDSESVTLSTYYPAPSGVYTNMITTGNTYLARDGGGGANCVGSGLAGATMSCVATGSSQAYAKMHIIGVSQNTLAVDSPSYPEITLRVNNTIKNYTAVATSPGGYFTGSATNDWIFRNDGGASIKFGRGGTADLTIDPNGSIIVRDKMDVATSFVSRVNSAAAGPCTDQTVNYPTPGGGTAAMCTGSQYVTLIDGFMTKKYIIAGVPAFPGTNPTITARCCPCPTGGCPSL